LDPSSLYFDDEDGSVMGGRDLPFEFGLNDEGNKDCEAFSMT
jgi:hypothetical protein